MERPHKQPLEMRRYPRYRLEVRVTVTASRPQGVLGLWGRLADISEGGVSCTLMGELLEGESVNLEFTLPMEGEPLRVRAVVRHRAGLHYGMEFVILSPEQQDKIRRLARVLPKVA